MNVPVDPVARHLVCRGLPEPVLERACFAETVAGTPLVDALLETGGVPLSIYDEAARAVWGLPAVGPETVARAPAEGAAWLPVTLARDAVCVPLSLGDRLRVVTGDPGRLEAFGAIRAHANRPVEVLYGPPGAVAEAFSRVYHVVSAEDFYRRAGRRRLDPEAFGKATRPEAGPSTDQLAASAFLERQVWEATSSRAVIDAVLAFLSTSFDAAAFFLVEADLLLGHASVGDTSLSKVVMPREGPTLFARTLAAGKPYQGPPRSHLRDWVISRRVGRPKPRSVLYLPIVMDEVPVGLFYAESASPAARLPRPSTPDQLVRLVAAGFAELFARHLQAVFDLAREAERERALSADDLAVDPVAEIAAATRPVPDAVRRLVALGAAAVPSLAQAFPGTLKHEVDVDPDAREDVARHSELLAAMIEMGAPAVPVALAALSDTDPVNRRFGALCFTRLPARDAVRPLIALLVDSDRAVSDAAVRALSRQRRRPDAPEIARSLAAGLSPEVDTTLDHRLRIIRVLGALAVPSSVPALIPLLEVPGLTEETEAALEAIAGRSPSGRDRPRAWKRWWLERLA